MITKEQELEVLVRQLEKAKKELEKEVEILKDSNRRVFKRNADLEIELGEKNKLIDLITK